MPKVLVILGSKSDKTFGDECLEQLGAFGVEGTMEISSAHRKPAQTAALASQAESQGFEVIIAMAGLSAALPGVVAAHSNLPVIGVPLPAALGGGVLHPAVNSLITKASDPGEVGGMLGISSAFYSGANAIAPLFYGSLFQWFGAPVPFMAGGLILLVLWFLAPRFILKQ